MCSPELQLYIKRWGENILSPNDFPTSALSVDNRVATGWGAHGICANDEKEKQDTMNLAEKKKKKKGAEVDRKRNSMEWASTINDERLTFGGECRSQLERRIVHKSVHASHRSKYRERGRGRDASILQRESYAFTSHTNERSQQWKIGVP